jgi:hypothetical protein
VLAVIAITSNDSVSDPALSEKERVASGGLPNTGLMWGVLDSCLAAAVIGQRSREPMSSISKLVVSSAFH